MPEGQVPKDLFEPIEDENKKEDLLQQLSKLCDDMRKAEFEIEKIESNLKDKKDEAQNISRNLIPAIFNSLNLSEIKLITGEKVSVEDKVKASIANKNYNLAYAKMIEAEGGDEQAKEVVDSLFKSAIVIDQDLENASKTLTENSIPYEMNNTIHNQTLIKYCKGKLDNGKTIPEGISVFQYQETKIKIK